jgi:multimeric flavodoxin WrbA
MSKIAVVYHSIYDHTKLQAEAVLRSAQSVPSVTAELYTAEEATARLDELDAAEAVIFGCPTYMGIISAGMKVLHFDSSVDEMPDIAAPQLKFSDRKITPLAP